MIVADQLEIIRARLGIDPSIWIVTSADKASEHGAAPSPTPRYVWVPTQDTFDAPERSGVARGSVRRKQLLTRSAGLELHIWVDSQADGEARMNDVIAAWMAEANTSVSFEKANWHADSIVGRGFLLTLNMRVKVPVMGRAHPVARATKVAPDASEVDHGDGNLDWGETT